MAGQRATAIIVPEGQSTATCDKKFGGMELGLGESNCNCPVYYSPPYARNCSNSPSHPARNGFNNTFPRICCYQYQCMLLLPMLSLDQRDFKIFLLLLLPMIQQHFGSISNNRLDRGGWEAKDCPTLSLLTGLTILFTFPILPSRDGGCDLCQYGILDKTARRNQLSLTMFCGAVFPQIGQ